MITTKNGLLYRNGECLGVGEADRLAYENGFMCAERMVHALEYQASPRGTSILQEWVMRLPIRYQGVLIVALRGYDGWVKHSEPKRLIREMRGLVLVPADARELEYPRGFMDRLSPDNSGVGFKAFSDEMDSLNVHYVLHLAHAIEIIGYCHPNAEARTLYEQRYRTIVRMMHMLPESAEDLRFRLTEDRIANKSVETH